MRGSGLFLGLPLTAPALYCMGAAEVVVGVVVGAVVVVVVGGWERLRVEGVLFRPALKFAAFSFVSAFSGAIFCGTEALFFRFLRCASASIAIFIPGFSFAG